MPDVSALLRIGHKGAHHIAPGNTLASFDAALAHGVDMIEFDILPEFHDRPGEGRLVLAHDYVDGIADALDLDAGLAHLATGPFAQIRLDVDLKLPGYEDRVVAALRAHAGVHYLRRKVVRAARRHLSAGRCDAIMVNWRLVSRALVEVVREEGGELYVWTVDDAARIRALEALGVTGVITNDPRLFTAG
jgi:glycerophosphoryl diester phosphodiesterase